MAVYRFRITFEDHEDVYRDIEIKSGQTFEEFHKVIQQAIGFDASKPASFFMSDDFWKKGQEITLRPEDAKPVDDDDDDYPSRNKPAPKLVMNQCKLASHIDDPHQKFVYLFDPSSGWTFYVELMKIVEADPKETYPRIVKSMGLAPKQYKNVGPPPPVDEEDEEDTPKREKVFQAEEAYDESGEDEEGLESEEGESEEESGGDYDSESFGDPDQYEER